MALIQLTTRIAAPVERVFDLARSIDAHMASTSQSGERAVEGRTSGLINAGETVTWEATHFGVKQRLKVKITKLERPFLFEDEMISGAFSSMTHQHRFEESNGETKMSDRFEYQAPLGFLGRIAESLFLTKYMKSFLKKRNEELKEMAESDRWRNYINEDAHQGAAHNVRKRNPQSL
ncbi:SRPBCC family protein [Puniceicoccaceae bacterium K14]|nr:SRPBCC family protein [Puniceicoccaceae bacterium K14]